MDGSRRCNLSVIHIMKEIAHTESNKEAEKLTLYLISLVGLGLAWRWRAAHMKWQFEVAASW